MRRYENNVLSLPSEALISSPRRFSRFLTSVSLLLVFLGAAGWCSAQVSVLTQHNDIGRTGQNNKEGILTPANVNKSHFGLLFSQPVDGQIYAQPLYLPLVQIPGSGTHDVVFVATEHDSVYAFDADYNGGGDQAPLWKASLLSTAHGAPPGATTVPSTSIADDIVPEYGISGTPVIDPNSGLLYVVSFTLEGSAYVLRLHALSVSTGAELLGGPVVIDAEAAGVGNGSTNGTLTFDPRWENQRSGLLLLDGVLYLSFASHADNGDWHGWLLSYNPSTLAQISAYCASPNGVGSGFWMGGNGLAADLIDPVGHPNGRMFVATGNGDYKATAPYNSSMDFGDSIVNFDLSRGILTPQDAFTPSNQATLDASDADLGAGGVLVLPNQPGPYPHLLVQEGKSGTLYLINRDQMGGYNTADNIVQEVASTLNGNGIWGAPVYWNGYVFTNEARNHLKAYSLNNGQMQLSSVSPETFTFPGPGLATSGCLAPCTSTGGNPNGILWAIETDSYNTGGNAVLRAYNPTNLGTEYYNSNQIPSRDSAGPAVKFAIPTVTNGKVYVGAGGQLDVYGLLDEMPAIVPPVISPGTSTFTQPIQVTITDATPGATIHYTADGSAPTVSSPTYTGPFTVNSTQTISAIAVAPGYVWISPVSATFTSLNNTANPIMSPAGGTFSTLPTVTISDTSANAAIYYTLDGSMPTTSSTRYTGPITLAGSKTIKAIAFAPGLTGSTIQSQTYTTQSGVDLSLGFSQAQSIMTFNGSTGLDDSRLQLTNGYTADTGSAFVTVPLNIQAFTTRFLFQLSNPQADGITFTIQAEKPTAVGPFSRALGYATIPNSVAIKFDFFNDQGEGSDSTGLYINGVEPTIPAINLTNSGINLASGDLMAVNLTYDSKNLEMTIEDEVTEATWSTVWPVDIAQIVGGKTAYVGFTGSTQILTASQKIAAWTYTALTPGLPSTTATPVISPGTSTYARTQIITLSDSTPNAVMYYTTDGTAPTTTSNVYTAPFPVSTSQRLQVMARAPNGVLSAMASATYTLSSGTTTAVPNYTVAAHGFGYGSLILNGAALVANTMPYFSILQNTQSLQLTDGSLNEAHSAFFANPVNIQSFTSDFDFQIPSGTAEGFAFVIQNYGLNAIGTNLGYGIPAGSTTGYIPISVALGFDINGTAGEGANSIVLYSNGKPSTLPATNLNSSGIQLTSGHALHAHVAYDGATLTLTLTDGTAGYTATASYPVTIPGILGSPTAYVGFTGATNATAGATQNILDWTYAIVTPGTVTTATPIINPAAGTYPSPTAVTITDATKNAVIYYTTDGTTPTASSNVYSGPIPINATGTILAVAQAPGDSMSAAASAGFTIQIPSASYSAGFTSQGLALNGGAAVAKSILQLTDGGAYEARSAFFTSPMNVQGFSTSFDFQVLNGTADGFAFVIQNEGLTSIGSPGSGLGYGVEPGVDNAAIARSVAVKFDIHSNAGEGNDSTGVFVDGASPTTPATNLTNTGIILASGHKIHARISYSGTTLVLALVDTVTNATATQSYQVNIPATVGSNTAYVGFTGGTGGVSAIQNILDWTYTASSSAPATVSYAAGFAGAQGLALNSASIKGAVLQLTDGGANEARSAYYARPVNIQAFSSSFDFQLLNATADGFTFVLQNQGLGAVGSSGAGLGYGAAPPANAPLINKSVAIKFDLHNNAGEGNDSTGVYLNGAAPTLPATNLSNSGVILSSGHPIHAQIRYNGSALSLTLTDTVTDSAVTGTYQVNIPATVGSNTAYVGFTGGTGGVSAVQNILDWTYTVSPSNDAVASTLTTDIGA